MPSPASAQTLVEIKAQLTAAQAEHKRAVETKADKSTVDMLQQQVDALDLSLHKRHGSSFESSTPLLDQLKANEDVSKLLRDKRGTAMIHLDAKTSAQVLQRKTTMTEGVQGFATSGVLQIDRTSGIVAEARQALTLRDVLTARPTSLPIVDFVKVLTPLSIASPVPEGNDKPENQLQFVSVSERVRTLATWLPASRQILDDIVELNGFIDTSLRYYVDEAEELQFLAGDSTGENLHGIIPQASAFNTTLLHASAGWNRIDIVGLAISQITTAKEIQPTFIVIHPADWWAMRLQKDGFGRYILTDNPQSMVRPNIFGLDVVATTSIPVSTFLVGSGDPAAIEIRDRMEMVVEISTSHLDFFQRNLLAIRAEKRVALLTKRPSSFVTGTFSQSPS